MVPNSHRDIAAFYYTLWPIRTKCSIVLGSHTAQYTGCCGDGSPSLLRPTLPSAERSSKLSLHIPLVPESFSICGRAMPIPAIPQVTPMNLSGLGVDLAST